MSGIRLSLYDDATDEQIGDPMLLPSLPYPGLRIITPEGAWEVVRVQVTIAERWSLYEVPTGQLTSVDAMVVRSVGVHHT